MNRTADIERIARNNKQEPEYQPMDNDPDSRDAIVAKIDRRRRAEMLADHEAEVEAREERMNKAWDEKVKAEDKEIEAEMDYKKNRMDPKEAQELFMKSGPEYGGFSDIWQNADKVQKKAILNAIDEKMAAPGVKYDDYRIYKEVGDKYRERQKKAKKDEDLAKIYRNEDKRAAIAEKVRTHRRLENMEHRAKNYVPQTQEEIKAKFAQDFPEIVNNPTLLSKAVLEINSELQRKAIDLEEPGPIRWETYREAGNKVRQQVAIEDFRMARGQKNKEEES